LLCDTPTARPYTLSLHDALPISDEFKTQEGIVKGKLPYIAPEMYQSSEASVASDVYATGVMLYQLLSGKNPFSGKDMSAIVTRRSEEHTSELQSRENLVCRLLLE